MIAILDYGAGNLRSAYHALKACCEEVAIFTKAADIPANLSGLVLPGDGAFPFAFDQLKKKKFVSFIRHNREVPLLGICVGFQLLFSASEEDGGSEGLDLIPGQVKRFLIKGKKVPHMGWNQIVSFKEGSPHLQGIKANEFFYFVHSYYADVRDREDSILEVDYGLRFCAGVAKEKRIGYQFHPEKSHAPGWHLIKNFVSYCGH